MFILKRIHIYSNRRAESASYAHLNRINVSVKYTHYSPIWNPEYVFDPNNLLLPVQINTKKQTGIS